MSKFLQPPLYKKKALENQLTNLIYGMHDLMCGCTQIKQHIHAIFCEEKCHHSTDTTDPGNHGKEEENFDEGDLDALFAASDDADG